MPRQARVRATVRGYRPVAQIRAGIGGEGSAIEYVWQGTKAIELINDAVVRAMRRAEDDATEYWRDEIWNKEDHPDMTGTERDAGEFVVTVENNRARLVGRVTLSAEYPIYEEFGTRFREGHFPLRRTMDYIAPRIREYLAQELAGSEGELMVAGLVLPDLPVAIIQKLKADSDVTSLVGGRIAMAWPEGRRAWNPTSQSVILVRVRGGQPPSMYDESRVSRIELHMYGAGETPNTRRRISRLIWRTAEPVLCPPQGAGLAMGWANAPLRIIVRWIQPEMSEPLMLPEPNTNWDQAVMSYLVGWSVLARGGALPREIAAAASLRARLTRSVPAMVRAG